MLILPLNHLPVSPTESCLLLHLSLGTKRVNDETQTLFAVREKSKVCQGCEDSGERLGELEWKERMEDV